MIYVIGVIGFLGGFMAGQLVLHFLLRHRSTEDLLHDKKLKLIYGTLGWVFAIVGCYAFIEMYKLYFGG